MKKWARRRDLIHKADQGRRPVECGGLTCLSDDTLNTFSALVVGETSGVKLEGRILTLGLIAAISPSLSPSVSFPP